MNLIVVILVVLLLLSLFGGGYGFRSGNNFLAGGGGIVGLILIILLVLVHAKGHLSRDLVLVGLVGMSDPLRDEAKAAISTYREAGIRTVMITGDQQSTAAEIA